MRVTVFYFHPFTRRSESNRALITAASRIGEVRIRDIYELYPDFGIDVDVEQQALLDTDLVIFQHPFYWYSCPALMKEWLDAVLEYGWAYGTGGDKLRGKHWLQIITTGGPERAYRRGGTNEFTVPEFLRPFERTAHLCEMTYHSPLLVQGTFGLEDSDRENYGEQYSKILKSAIEGNLPPLLSTR